MRAIYYDTETTGVRSEKDRIIEIAAFDPISKESFVKLINPQMSIPQEATNIHHITDDMVAEAATFAVVGKEFAEFCGENAVLIAHNNDAFDKLFLEAEFSRSGLTIHPWRYVDTLKWARKFRPDLPRHSLQSLREHFGIPANQAHRALDDVIILEAVFSRLIDDLTLHQVMNLLNKPQVLSRMPFGKHQGKALKDVPKDYIAWLAKSGAFDKSDNHGLKAAFEALGAFAISS